MGKLIEMKPPSSNVVMMRKKASSYSSLLRTAAIETAQGLGGAALGVFGEKFLVSGGNLMINIDDNWQGLIVFTGTAILGGGRCDIRGLFAVQNIRGY